MFSLITSQWILVTESGVFLHLSDKSRPLRGKASNLPLSCLAILRSQSWAEKDARRTTPICGNRWYRWCCKLVMGRFRFSTQRFFAIESELRIGRQMFILWFHFLIREITIMSCIVGSTAAIAIYFTHKTRWQQRIHNLYQRLPTILFQQIMAFF